MSTATIASKPSKLLPLSSLPAMQTLTDRLKSLDAQLGEADETIENRRAAELEAWRFEQTRALANGTTPPPRPMTEVLELDERRQQLVQARGFVSREVRDLIDRESNRVRQETQAHRLAIYRRQLAAMKELLAASRELEGYELDLVNRGYAVPHGSLVQFMPIPTQESGIEKFLASVKAAEGAAL